MKKIITLLTTLFIVQISYGQYVILGSGSAISVFSPIDRHNDYSVYEIVYPQADINMTGTINGFDIERVDGTNTDSIENVRLYMKHSSSTSLSNGSFDTTGYTRVFSGSFPNDAGSGWRGVQLDTPFVYDNMSNLQVIILKDYQPAIANTPVTPRWYYTLTSTPRARREYGSVPITNATTLTTTNFASNARLAFNNVAVVELSGGSTLSAYPNPTHDFFNINVPSDLKAATIAIYNIKGEVVFEKPVNADEKFATPVLTPGMYLLRMTDLESHQVYNTKLMVE